MKLSDGPSPTEVYDQSLFAQNNATAISNDFVAFGKNNPSAGYQNINRVSTGPGAGSPAPVAGTISPLGPSMLNPDPVLYALAAVAVVTVLAYMGKR